MQKIYDTERLTLKVLEESDAPLVLKFYERNRKYFEPWEYLKGEAFFTLAYHEKGLSLERKAHLNGNILRLWMFKHGENIPIGMVGLSNIIRGPFQSCFLGYKVDCEQINRGYATEGIKKIVQIAFDELGLHRIEAYAMPENLPSISVLKKVGFENEGLSKRFVKVNGKWEDHFRFALINE